MTGEGVQRIVEFLPALPALLVSLVVHEYAHASVATWLGDPTPRRQGRLTLSPLAHLDLVGSVLFPLLLLVSAGTWFGWARPVQFNAGNFPPRVSPRTGAALTAVAGPVSNLLLALLAVFALRLVVALPVSEHTGSMLRDLCVAMISINVLLAVFNVLPVPPLDGSYLLPRSFDRIKIALAPYSFLIFLAVFFVPIPGLNGSLGSLVIRPLQRGVLQLLLAIGNVGS